MPPDLVLRRSRRFFLALLLGLLSGCGMPDRDVEERLTQPDVVGTWKLTAESLQLLQRDKFQTAPEHLYTIAFRLDGTCTFASVDNDFYNNHYEVVEGTWRVEHNTRGDSNVTKRNALCLDLQGRMCWLNFDRDEQKRLLLWNYYGDPDMWEFLEYIPQP